MSSRSTPIAKGGTQIESHVAICSCERWPVGLYCVACIEERSSNHYLPDFLKAAHLCSKQVHLFCTRIAFRQLHVICMRRAFMQLLLICTSCILAVHVICMRRTSYSRCPSKDTGPAYMTRHVLTDAMLQTCSNSRADRTHGSVTYTITNE
jgi:hypothetical protein